MNQPSLLILLLVCANAGATSGFDAPESRETGLRVLPHSSALYDMANPAISRRLPANDHDLRIDVAASAAYELGDVENFINRIDDLQSELRSNTRVLTLESYINRYGSDVEAIANAVVADFNSQVIGAVNRQIALVSNDSIYGLVRGSFGSPINVVQHVLGGSIVFGTNLTAASKLLVLGDELKPYTLNNLVDKIVQVLSSPDPSVDFLLPDTDTAILVRSAIIDEMSLSFSRRAWQRPGGQLFVEARANYYNVKLSRFAKRLRDYASNESSKNLLDDYSDDDASYNSAFGLDTGMLWVTNHYRVGAAINNINQPEFHYNKIDTSGYSGTAVPRDLNEDRTWRMNVQLRLEGAAYSLNQHWSLGTSIDANSVEDALGHKYQWLSAGVAYNHSSGWVPELRASYHANTRGSKIHYVTTGLTLFDAVSFDIASSVDSIYIEKNDAVSFHGRAARSMIYRLRLEFVI